MQKQADELLRKLGYKGEPLMRPRPMGDEPVEEVQSADV